MPIRSDNMASFNVDTIQRRNQRREDAVAYWRVSCCIKWQWDLKSGALTLTRVSSQNNVVDIYNILDTFVCQLLEPNQKISLKMSQGIWYGPRWKNNDGIHCPTFKNCEIGHTGFGWWIQTPQMEIPQRRNKWAELMISTETCQIPMVPYDKGTHGALEWPRQLKHTGQHPRQEATQMALGTSKACRWVISFVLLSTRMGRNEEQAKPTEMSLGTVLGVTATRIPSLGNG